jgi:hypothetical protein
MEKSVEVKKIIYFIFLIKFFELFLFYLGLLCFHIFKNGWVNRLVLEIKWSNALEIFLLRLVFIDWIQIPLLIKFRNAPILLLMVSNVGIHFFLSVIGTSIVEFSVTSYFEHFIKIDWWVLFFSPLIAKYISSFKFSKTSVRKTF